LALWPGSQLGGRNANGAGDCGARWDESTGFVGEQLAVKLMLVSGDVTRASVQRRSKNSSVKASACLTSDPDAARPDTTSPVTPARQNTSGKSDPTPTPRASRSARLGAASAPDTATCTSTHSACVTLARAQPASRRARAAPAGEHAQQGTRRPQQREDAGSHPDAPQPGEHQNKDQLEPVAEIDDQGVVTHFIYASRSHVPDLMVKSGVAYRLLVDQLGSVRMVVRVSDSEVMQQIDYDPWGVPTLVSGDWDVQPFGFAGGVYDSETGLVRFGARDYDTGTGRWIAKDPVRFDGGYNLYAYANNDPVNFLDKTGEGPEAAIPWWWWVPPVITMPPLAVPIAFCVGASLLMTSDEPQETDREKRARCNKYALRVFDDCMCCRSPQLMGIRA
jgi:RHS repeat-associated protein